MIDYSEFFSSLKKCPSGERAALRRCCGKMLQDADGQAIVVFYRYLPYGVPEWQEKYWFAAACFSCLWKEEQTGIPLEAVFGRLKKDSDSLEHRLASLLDMHWDDDGFFLNKLSRMVKMAAAKGYTVDCGKLLEDLLWWNHENQNVQRKWARAMYAKNTDQLED